MARDDELDLDDLFNKQIAGWLDSLEAKFERGLTKAAEHLCDALEAASPVKTGEYKKNWRYKPQYRLNRYVGNITMVSRPYGRGGEMPLSTLLEYGAEQMTDGPRPHIKSTGLREADAMQQIIADELNK